MTIYSSFPTLISKNMKMIEIEVYFIAILSYLLQQRDLQGGKRIANEAIWNIVALIDWYYMMETLVRAI